MYVCASFGPCIIASIHLALDTLRICSGFPTSSARLASCSATDFVLFCFCFSSLGLIHPGTGTDLPLKTTLHCIIFLIATEFLPRVPSFIDLPSFFFSFLVPGFFFDNICHSFFSFENLPHELLDSFRFFPMLIDIFTHCQLDLTCLDLTHLHS